MIPLPSSPIVFLTTAFGPCGMAVSGSMMGWILHRSGIRKWMGVEV
jgi:hypothetical protein